MAAVNESSRHDRRTRDNRLHGGHSGNLPTNIHHDVRYYVVRVCFSRHDNPPQTTSPFEITHSTPWNICMKKQTFRYLSNDRLLQVQTAGSILVTAPPLAFSALICEQLFPLMLRQFSTAHLFANLANFRWLLILLPLFVDSEGRSK